MSALETKRITMPAKNSFPGSSSTVIQQEFRFEGNTPSWVRPGNVLGQSNGSLRVEGNRVAGWISFQMEEGYEVERLRAGKRVPGEFKWVSRATSLTLDRRQAEALRDFLNAVLGGSSREAKVL